MEVYKTFIVPFDKELIKTKHEKQNPIMIYQSETPAPEEIVVRKHQIDTVSYTSSLSSSTGETGLTRGTRVNATPEKRIPKKKKYIKSKYLSPFIPGNKRLLNKDTDNKPETTDTSLSEKDDMSHTSPDEFTKNSMTKKLQIMMTNTRRKLRKFKKVMKVLIILKLQILCVMIVLSIKPNNNKKH